MLYYKTTMHVYHVKPQWPSGDYTLQLQTYSFMTSSQHRPPALTSTLGYKRQTHTLVFFLFLVFDFSFVHLFVFVSHKTIHCWSDFSVSVDTSRQVWNSLVTKDKRRDRVVTRTRPKLQQRPGQVKLRRRCSTQDTVYSRGSKSTRYGNGRTFLQK